MGVTYSWLKRRSARAKPVSPGLTTGDADFSSSRASLGRTGDGARPYMVRLSRRIMWRAKIFSATVMGGARLLL